MIDTIAMRGSVMPAIAMLAVACGGKKETPPPVASTAAAAPAPTLGAARAPAPDAAAAAAIDAATDTAAADAPRLPIVPPTGACAGHMDGSGPVECPYPPGDRRARGDFAAAFERGGTCESAGTLRLTTGKVVAADPLVFLPAKPFTTEVPPGHYPVTLAIDDGSIALALLRIGDARPVRWKPALLPGEKPRRGGVFRYPVDAGTGSYVDHETALEIDRRESAVHEWCVARVNATVDAADTDAWQRALTACQAQHNRDLYELLRDAGYHTQRSWANACVDPATGANLVVFASGGGDGAYPVYVGYDAKGAPVAFVTDFGLLDDDDDR